MTMQTTVQPHPVVADLMSAIDMGLTADVDALVVKLNALIAGTHSYCWVHHEVEAARFDTCLECGHGWEAAQELIDDDYAVSLQLFGDAQLRPADEIYACPHCAHDF